MANLVPRKFLQTLTLGKCEDLCTQTRLTGSYTLERIRVVPPFPRLWKFPEGRKFKQWTGDDSKGLMKVSDVSIIRVDKP